MDEEIKSILVVGFNTRPLACSLSKAGYDVYAVDFFGDLDLYPCIKDCLIVVKNLNASYDLVKDDYGKFLADFAISMAKKHQKIDSLIIGSGLDDAFKERESILKEVETSEHSIQNLNNDLNIIKKARDIDFLHTLLKKRGFLFPKTFALEKYDSKDFNIQFPFLLKKRKGSGGINIYKIEKERDLPFLIEKLKKKDYNPSDWLIQEYIDGIPVSCTIISNGNETEVVSINRQIIGEKFLNSPKDFMYCGNIVPANLFKEDNKIISEIAITFANELGLKGINGFDFVLKNHQPYFMEINPRIPGSISASETALGLNLLDLHVKSFNPMKWKQVKDAINNAKFQGFATKLIFFAPKEITVSQLNEINRIEYVHDKTEPYKVVSKTEPLCTVLYKDKSFSDSYFNALKVIDEIKKIIE